MPESENEPHPDPTSNSSGENDQDENMDFEEQNEEDGEEEELTEEEKEMRKQAKKQTLQRVREMIQKKDMDGLIVASKHHPRPIVLALIEYVLPSRPIIVFCQHKEQLLDCYLALRDRGGVLSLRLTETWLREYQILPNRSHPEINMSGTGGYLLTGMKVAS